MQFSILHISDLHKNLSDEVPNEWLVDSIAHDFNRFEENSPPILKPQICIVSGDLVYGISPVEADASKELERQYSEAYDFLVKLSDRFFDRDRSRVIIVPGNHDIDFSEVMGSGLAVPIPATQEEKVNLIAELFHANSHLRWSWRELEFFRINDFKKYLNRLKPFADMYEKFYLDKRSYSLDPDSQYSVFDYPDLNFSVLALNSCHNNDPLQRYGIVNPSALTAACREARSPKRSGWVVAATWHHNLAGGPMQDDFLDASFLQILIDAGTSLGFHGHQHRADCFDERYRLGNNPRKITIVSAGTLCAEPKNISPGVSRGYNIVELDTEIWTGRVHQRQMVNQLENMPVWGPGHFVDSNASYLDFDLCKPVSNRPEGLDAQLALERAFEYLGETHWEEALDELMTMKSDSFVRRMIVSALLGLEDNQRTIKTILEPKSSEEAVLLGGAILEDGTVSDFKRFISFPFIDQNTDASVSDIVSRLERKYLK